MVSGWDEYAASTQLNPVVAEMFVSFLLLVVDFISPLVSSVAVGSKQSNNLTEPTEPNHVADEGQLKLVKGMQRNYDQKSI